MSKVKWKKHLLKMSKTLGNLRTMMSNTGWQQRFLISRKGIVQENYLKEVSNTCINLKLKRRNMLSSSIRETLWLTSLLTKKSLFQTRWLLQSMKIKVAQCLMTDLCINHQPRKWYQPRAVNNSLMLIKHLEAKRNTHTRSKLQEIKVM